MTKEITQYGADLMDKLPHVKSKDPLVGFFYLLMRDHLPAGVVMQLLIDSTEKPDCVFTNGHLAKFAEFCAYEIRQANLQELLDAVGADDEDDDPDGD